MPNQIRFDDLVGCPVCGKVKRGNDMIMLSPKQKRIIDPAIAIIFRARGALRKWEKPKMIPAIISISNTACPRMNKGPVLEPCLVLS